MSSTIIALVLLATPGFIFELCREAMARFNKRGERDLLSALTTIVLVSLPTLFFAFTVSGEVGNRIYADLALGKGPSFLNYDDVVAHRSDWAAFLSIVGGVSAATGLIFGKLGAWGGWLLLGKHPFSGLSAGIVPPQVIAAVLSTTKIGTGNIVYRGPVHALQIGPEGRVDHIVIQAPQKSILEISTLPDGVQGPPEIPIPRAVKPFVEVGNHIRAGKTDRLDFMLIESEDIANVFFQTIQPGKGDWFDHWVYRRLRSFGLMHGRDNQGQNEARREALQLPPKNTPPGLTPKSRRSGGK
jgi:hypothetical protein